MRTPELRTQAGSQVAASVGLFTRRYFFGRAHRHDFSTGVTTLRTQVDHIVGSLDHIQVMLDHDDGVAGVH